MSTVPKKPLLADDFCQLVPSLKYMLKKHAVFSSNFERFLLTPDAGQIHRLLVNQKLGRTKDEIGIYPLSAIPPGYSLYYKKHATLPSRKGSMDEGRIRVVPSKSFEVAVVVRASRSDQTHRVRKGETALRDCAKAYVSFVRKYKHTFYKIPANIAASLRLLDAVKEAARPLVVVENGVQLVKGESGPLQFAMAWELRPNSTSRRSMDVDDHSEDWERYAEYAPSDVDDEDDRSVYGESESDDDLDVRIEDCFSDQCFSAMHSRHEGGMTTDQADKYIDLIYSRGTSTRKSS